MKQTLNLTLPQKITALKGRLSRCLRLPLALVATGLLAGCASAFVSPADAFNVKPKTPTEAGTAANLPEVITLRAGDTLKISFPGSPNLNTSQQIRRDGKITLSLVGEVDAAGLTPPALEKKLVDLYASQISSKQISVAVESSTFPVYVTGMILHPGKIVADHPLSALEAVMEAGGFDYSKADLRNVTVIRREGNTMKNYKLNLKAVLQGKTGATFELKPDDIVYVPERFSMF
jgi:polysaccharide export outer membrane protein